MADPTAPVAPAPAPSPEPQPFTAAQPSAPPSSPVTGTNYAAELLTNLTVPAVPPQAPAFPVQVPIVPPTPDPSQQFAPQPVQPVNVQPAPQPVQPVNVQPAPQPVQPVNVQPAPPTPPASVDRYSAPPEDPLSGLQPLPNLAPEQQIADPQFTSDQQNHAWAALRAQSKANRRAAEEAQRKFNELVESTKGFQNEKAEFASQLNAKDQEISQLQDEIGRMDLSRSPAFRAKYDQKLDAQHAQIMDVLVRNGVDKDQAFDLARDVIVSDPKDVPNMISQLPTYAQGEVMVFANQAGAILAERERELGDWRNAQAGLEAAAQREGGVQTAQRIQQAADKAIEAFRSLTPETGLAPAYRVTDPEFSSARDAREQQFRQWVGRASEQDRYMAMLEGFMAPKTYEMLDQVMRENADLKRRLQARGWMSAPPVSPSPYAPPPPPPPPPPKPENVQDGFARADVGGAQAYAQSMLTQMFGQR